MKHALLFALLACGCTKDIAYQPVEVKVPVTEACAVQPAIPEWPLQQTAATAPLFDKVKNALAEIETRKAYEAKLQAALSACP